LRGSLSRSGELALVYNEDNDEAVLVRIDPESLRRVEGRRLAVRNGYVRVGTSAAARRLDGTTRPGPTAAVPASS
jgi:hypothetical protein